MSEKITKAMRQYCRYKPIYRGRKYRKVNTYKTVKTSDLPLRKITFIQWIKKIIRKIKREPEPTQPEFTRVHTGEMLRCAGMRALYLNVKGNYYDSK